MATGFTQGIDGDESAVVTRYALPSRRTVIHLRRAERGEVGVTCFAARLRRHMINRLAQARASRYMAIDTRAP